MPVSLPASKEQLIGRFRLLRLLGRGAEGEVWLASDPRLGREVAIKTLAPGAVPEASQAGRLLGAARTIGALSHPNIIPVFETGIHDGNPFVVMEYVEGRTLARQLAADGPVPMARSIVLMSQILAGIAQMHERELIHGDIKPANILIGSNGMARVGDFGLLRHERASATQGPAGTVRYMAPEFFSGGRTDCRLDVFALGLVFHEMLTGEPVLPRGNVHAQIYRIINDAPQPPSASDARIAPEIDAIVLKALQKDPAKRYSSAGEMKRELDRFRVAPAAGSRVDLREQAVHGTIDFLVRRMAHKSDFPALSATFTRINRISAQADDASIKALSDFVMCDFALTQKLLRLVNSAAVGAGKVTKVSRAISILGVAQLRSMATAMMLAHDDAGRKSPQIAAALTDAFVAGVIARNIGRMTGLPAVEELFICGMFSPLGELLTLHYLADEHAEIARRMAAEQMEADAAARGVLGVTFDELGSAIAAHWQFPAVIIHALAPLPPGTLAAAGSAADRVWHCSGYARELCALARTGDPVARERALEAHIGRYAQTIAVEPPRVRELMAHSIELAGKYIAAAGIAMSRTAMLAGMGALCAAADIPAMAQDPRGAQVLPAEPNPPAKEAPRPCSPASLPPVPLAAREPSASTGAPLRAEWFTRLALSVRALF